MGDLPWLFYLQLTFSSSPRPPASLFFSFYQLWAYQVVLVVKDPSANAGDVGNMGLISESGRSPGSGQGNLL